MLAVHDLAYGFSGRMVGEGVTFSLAQGETLAVLGGNGAGKTTLFRTLLGLLPIRGGSIDIDGAPLASLTAPARAARIAYVPQHHVPAYAFSVTDAATFRIHVPIDASPRYSPMRWKTRMKVSCMQSSARSLSPASRKMSR